MNSDTVAWSARRYSSLLVEIWEDEAFIFDPASGETHLLNSSAKSLLEHLASQPCTRTQLIDWLHQADSGIDVTELASAIDNQLYQMALMGLIEACDVPEQPA